jgi:DNA-binding NtrC family response regulator
MTEKNAILVVEDDPLVSEVIAAALDDAYAITVVGTASEAMAKLDSGFRLMLLDCTLPGGVDTNLIPQADRIGTAVVLMSGDPGRMAKLTDQPRPFVLKPFTLVGLLDTVRTVLAAHPA